MQLLRFLYALLYLANIVSIAGLVLFTAAKEDIRYAYHLLAFDLAIFIIVFIILLKRKKTGVWPTSAKNFKIQLTQFVMLLLLTGFLIPFENQAGNILFLQNFFNVKLFILGGVFLGVAYILLRQLLKPSEVFAFRLAFLKYRIPKRLRKQAFLQSWFRYPTLLLSLVAGLGIVNILWIAEMAVDDYLGPTVSSNVETVIETPWLYHMSIYSGSQGQRIFFTQPSRDRVGIFHPQTQDTNYIRMPKSLDGDSYKAILVHNGKLIIGSIFNAGRIGFFLLDIHKDGLLNLQGAIDLPDSAVTIHHTKLSSPVMIKPGPGDTFFAIDEETNQLLHFSLTGELLAYWPLPYNAATNLTLSADFKTAWLRFAYSSALLVIDLANRRPRWQRHYPQGLFPFLGGGGLLVAEKAIYISSLPADSLLVLSKQGEIEKKVSTSAGPRLLRKVGLGAKQYIAILGYYSGVLELFDTSTVEVCQRLGVAKALHDVKTLANGDMYVTSKRGLHRIPAGAFGCP